MTDKGTILNDSRVIPPPPNARDLLAAAGLEPKKSWGQNFLREQDILRFISQSVRAKEDEQVVELGAGLGALTYYLVQDYPRVIAVERDRDLIPVLEESFAWADNLTLQESDAAKLDYVSMAAECGRTLVVVGNLPYQISSRIMVSVAGAHQAVRRCIVMVQKEVAQRVVAGPGSKSYGLLSVLVQRTFSGTLTRVVPPGCFLPPPKVHSAVLSLERREVDRSPELDAALVSGARAAFSSRRKTLRNSVAGGLGARPNEVEDALNSVGIDPKRRAESLDLNEFELLGGALLTAGLLGD